MLRLETTMWLLPVVFMIHDFEEIIRLETWVQASESLLARRFPRLSARLQPHLRRLTTRGFAFAAAEEFVLLSLFTLIAVEFKLHSFWAGILIGFLLHLLLHLIQFAFLRRFAASIVTSLFASVYCLFALRQLEQQGLLVWSQVMLWSVAFLVFIALNLKFVHGLAARWFKQLERRLDGPV